MRLKTFLLICCHIVCGCICFVVAMLGLFGVGANPSTQIITGFVGTLVAIMAVVILDLSDFGESE